MRQIRQVLRLHLEAGLSDTQVGRAVALSKTTVGKMVLFARAAGVDWAVAQTLNDAELEARLYPPPGPRSSRQPKPDYAWIHQELKRRWKNSSCRRWLTARRQGCRTSFRLPRQRRQIRHPPAHQTLRDGRSCSRRAMPARLACFQLER